MQEYISAEMTSPILAGFFYGQNCLIMQATFPGVKGFSARNLWFMKQWYSFYASNSENKVLLEELTGHVDIGSQKLKQLASEIQDEKLKQADSEFAFPVAFAYVPWMHHVLIMQKIEEKFNGKDKTSTMYAVREYGNLNLDKDPPNKKKSQSDSLENESA